ncbi:MAG: Hsp20/alpha crystallin family protein [Desulfobulbaceae bacterium]|nr:Hsp20/alpha crystallin family protein [Desulfobulbaceae bacterium]
MFRNTEDIDKIFGTMGFFKNQMNRLFDDFENERRSFTTAGSWPRTNFYEDEKYLTVYCMLPGIAENEINIKLHNNLLTIKGERQVDMDGSYTVLRKERNVKSFSRSFSLPIEIDVEKVSATLKNGILTVKLSKAKNEKPKKISVQAV